MRSIYFQLGDPASAFLDVRIRRGLSMALNRDAFGKTLFGGQYERYVFVSLNLGKWSMKVDDLEPDRARFYDYIPIEAKNLLSAAGATSQEFKLAYVADGGVSGGTANSRGGQVEAFRSMLEAVGVKTSLVPLNSQKDYIDAGKGYRQGYYPRDTIMQGASAEYTDVGEYLFSYFHSKSTSNQEHLNDPALDTMIDQSRAILNDEERLKVSRDIQKYIADKMYIVPSVSVLQLHAPAAVCAQLRHRGRNQPANGRDLQQGLAQELGSRTEGLPALEVGSGLKPARANRHKIT